MMAEESSSMIPVNEDSIKTSSSVVGGLAGFYVGGLPTAVIGTLGLTYVADQENEVGEAVRGLGQVSLQVWNVALSLNDKYKVTDRVKDAASDAFNKAKENDEKGTIAKIDETVSSATSKFDELNKEYDLGTQAKKLLATTATFSNKAIEKAIELNKENDYTGKLASAVGDAATKASEKAKESSK